MGETIEKDLNVIFHAGGSSAWVAAVNVSVIVVVVVYVDSKHHFITIIIIISQVHGSRRHIIQEHKGSAKSSEAHLFLADIIKVNLCAHKNKSEKTVCNSDLLNMKLFAFNLVILLHRLTCAKYCRPFRGRFSFILQKKVEQINANFRVLAVQTNSQKTDGFRTNTEKTNRK